MYDVIVVGAGLAGLATADELRARGYTVLTLEARDVAGGRVATENFPSGHPVDVGASYVSHRQQRILALAARAGVTCVPTTAPGEPQFVADLSGPIDESAIAEAVGAFAELDDLAQTIDPEAPWQALDAPDLDARSLDSWLRDRGLSGHAREIAERAIDGFFVRSSAEVSVLHAMFYARVNGGLCSLLTDHDEWTFAGGAAQLPRYLAAQLGDDLHLGEPVLRVLEEGSSANVVTLQATYRARAVVRAMPACVASGITWDPPLSTSNSQWAMRTPMGTGYKLLLQFDVPVWLDRGWSGEVVSAAGPIAAVRDASPADGSCGILVAFLTVAASAHHAAVGPAGRLAIVGERLTSWLGTPEPIAVLERRWGDVPYIRGEVATPGINTWAPYGYSLRAGAHLTVAAGTETATDYAFQMEGALQSAQRAVVDVVTLLS